MVGPQLAAALFISALDWSCAGEYSPGFFLPRTHLKFSSFVSVSILGKNFQKRRESIALRSPCFAQALGVPPCTPVRRSEAVLR
jgi:hypothetical protein